MTPRLRFVCETIANRCGWNGTPTISLEDRLVVVGGGSSNDTQEQAVLQGIDLDDGRSRFVTLVENEWPTVVEGSEPRRFRRSDGTSIFAAAVYRHNVDGRLIAVARDGQLIANDDLGEESHFRACDVGTKLWTAIEPTGVDDALVFTWTYRQARDVGAALRVVGERQPRWTCKERVLGVSGRKTVGVTADGKTLVLRDVRSGDEISRSSLGDGAVVAAVGALVLVADRTEQFAVCAKRNESVEADYLQEQISVEEWDVRTSEHPGVPLQVRALDPATGAERWTRAVEGDVLDLREIDDAGVTAIVSSTPAGLGTCEIVDTIGNTLSRFALPGRNLGKRPWRTTENDSHRIFGVTRSGLLLYAVDDLLIGIRYLDGGERVFELALPSSGRSFRRHMAERWLPKASVALTEDLLVVAGVTDAMDRIWVYDLLP